jgi:uncharacterized membrane-anchored protein
MRHEITKQIGDTATGLAVSGGVAVELGWFEFINANATGLGFISSVIFGIIGTAFYWLSYTKKDRNTEKIAELEETLAKIEDRKARDESR